jgi:hypothetical protein
MSARAPGNLISDFVQTLADCRQLYLNAGRQYCQQSRQSAKTPDQIMQWMDDLHRGLLIKVYMEVALADRSWQHGEQQFAQHLFQHLWDRRLEGAALRQAAQGLHQRAQRLSLRGVLQPFLELPVLRDCEAQLETIVMRVANLVAKADGRLNEQEADRLHKLQNSLHSLFAAACSSSRASPAEGLHWQREMGPTQQEVVTTSPRTPTPPPVPAARVGTHSNPEQTLRLALEQLDQLIGLEQVKREVQMLTNYLKVQQQRLQAGLPQTPLSLHLVFVGNPGTGKTSVARIVGQIYGAMGVLSKGHLVETDRSGLVAEYAGQTAVKTNRLIDQALDGVLFIDEAYSLIAEAGDDAFGREALQTLLKRMEDDRSRLAVILAGYPAPMERLMKSNPGLSSRFSRTLSFDDYDCVALAKIFGQLCQQNHYNLGPDVRCRLLLGLKWLHDHRDEHFGNGRLIRNLFEDAIRQLANRIADIAPLTRLLLTSFDPQDLRFPAVPAELWQRSAAASPRFQTHCPGCQQPRTLKPNMLGRRVRCSACHQTFAVDWAEPIWNSSATA